jgi:hypothetical protein
MVFLRCNWLPLPILYCPNLFIRKQLETINTRRIARDNKTAMRLFDNKGATEIHQLKKFPVKMCGNEAQPKHVMSLSRLRVLAWVVIW